VTGQTASRQKLLCLAIVHKGRTVKMFSAEVPVWSA
jgi:hypothetical protein